MANEAFKEMFREEYIAGFEKRQSLLRMTTTTEVDVKGQIATFLVADSGGATAQTRGLNGKIPATTDNLNQFQCILQEWHDLRERTGFNLYASQGNGTEIMQKSSMAVLNRKVDEDIVEALDGATAEWNGGTPTAATVNLVLTSIAELGEAFAWADAPLWCVITPKFWGQLMKSDRFTDIDFVNDKRFESLPKTLAFHWLGVNWLVNAALPGAGTANATCFLYSQAAIGHACDSQTIQTAADYDDKQDLSWCRATAYMGSKLLQNSGVIKLPHDDTAA